MNINFVRYAKIISCIAYASTYCGMNLIFFSFPRLFAAFDRPIIRCRLLEKSSKTRRGGTCGTIYPAGIICRVCIAPRQSALKYPRHGVAGIGPQCICQLVALKVKEQGKRTGQKNSLPGNPTHRTYGPAAGNPECQSIWHIPVKKSLRWL